jgi:Zn-dependent protease with chaperone function
MISINGKWYDGRTSAEIPAVCSVFDSGAVTITHALDGHRILSLPRFNLKVSPRLADTPRYLYFQDGEKFETPDNRTVDRIMKKFSGGTWSRRLYHVESHWRFVAFAVVALLIFMWGSVKYGVPFAAREISGRLPNSILNAAADQTLEVLDRTVLSESNLEEKVQNRLLNHFQSVLDAHPDDNLSVIFRKGGPVGPNAFALPNGTIIFTDEIIQLAKHDDELVAVLSHEIGHVVYRHGLQTVIQDSLLGFALLSITGDAVGSSELFLGLPVLLTQLAYSRTFEREADNYALSYLMNHDIPPIHFANLMRRMETSVRGHSEGTGSDWSDYLSSHPMTAERIRPFEGNNH